ncbi:MAG TPA: methyltransferase domain-containing protein [Ktedonobacteraceae bacterium]|nr:methyltransferase domain-containing protein [Ktedonobacteraceae bacterium]
MSHPNNTYILGSGQSEVERLQLQARTWMPEAEVMLDLIGIPDGWHCLDVGCGTVGILKPLSQRVGSAGRVVGSDIDPVQLAAARLYLQEEALNNVTLVEQDAFHPSFSHAQFDLVHARLLFTSEGNSAPDLLQKLISLTKPGGVVAVQEPISSSWNCYPQHWSWNTLKETLFKLLAQNGEDNNMGQYMYALLCQAGLERVQVRPAILLLRGEHPYMRLPILLATQLRQPILEAGLLSQEELDQAIEACEIALKQPYAYVTTFIMLQTWGYKSKQ